MRRGVVAFACLVALAGALLYRRIALEVAAAKGKVHVAHACSVWSPGIFDNQDHFEHAGAQIWYLQTDGALSMYDTPFGSVWYPTNSWSLLPAVVEESQTDPYHLRSMVKRGDIVIDIGTNVGTEARAALNAGARQVFAMETDPLNLDCLRRNLSSEIREKRVIVAPAASIDEIVTTFNLPRVNVIRLRDLTALRGASETIKRFHPRIAVSVERGLNDAETVPAIARRIWPRYRVQLTRCTKIFDRIQPEAALLTP